MAVGTLALSLYLQYTSSAPLPSAPFHFLIYVVELPIHFNNPSDLSVLKIHV
jgi:hypothetical protein